MGLVVDYIIAMVIVFLAIYFENIPNPIKWVCSKIHSKLSNTRAKQSSVKSKINRKG